MKNIDKSKKDLLHSILLQLIIGLGICIPSLAQKLLLEYPKILGVTTSTAVGGLLILFALNILFHFLRCDKALKYK